MIYLLFAFGAAAAAYQLLALAAGLRQLAQRDARASRALPPVSILKPIRGLDPDFYDDIVSHAVLKYPEYEILFGVSDPNDPALHDLERLAGEDRGAPLRSVHGATRTAGSNAGAPKDLSAEIRVPPTPIAPGTACAAGSNAAAPDPLAAEDRGAPIRIVHSATRAANRKAGVLADLAAEARHRVLVVNDSDIRVPVDYLARIVAPLEDPEVGMVTCLYRARAKGWAGRTEAVGIATDFAPSVLVAPLVGVSEFALGSTMAFRAADLEAIGGFAAIADYIADDYQLSRRIRGLGRRVVISRCVVETSVPDAGWGEMWRHQVRWARTIRLSRGGGYLGLPVTCATLWAVLLAGAGAWPAGLGLFALRLAAGLTTAAGVLGDRRALRDAFLIPLRDLIGLGIWAAGLFGSMVVWRDARLRLDAEGRIVEVQQKT